MNDNTTVVEARPAMSPKRAKFETLATARVKKAIKAIRIVANMGGKARYNYDFDSADVDKITGALTKEVDQLAAKMISPGRQLDIEFDLR
jgi:hypothetical protein